MRNPLIGAALLGLLAPPATAVAQSEFSGDWQDGFHAGISRALAKHQIRGCGQFRYKESAKQSGVFLVECTKDGKTYTPYRVNVSERTVKGPLEQ